jgi:hypothetical protein
MNARFALILIIALCGAMLLIAGCTTPAPSGGTAPTPAERTPVASTSGTDLGSVTSLLQSMDERLSLIAENTRPEGKGVATGNMVLFDNQGDTSNTITNGTALIALPQGKCDIAIYAAGITSYIILEEVKEQVGYDFARNRQVCLDTFICRRTVTLDKEYSYLYISYKPYNSAKTLSQVTLSYRCP